MLDYMRDGGAIQARAFEIIRDTTDLSSIPRDLEPVIVRIIQACGMVDIVADLVWSADAVEAGRAALHDGAPILVDSRGVAQGISKGLLPAACPIFCTLNQAKAVGTTRAAAAVDLWRGNLEGAVVAIGNAPTALFRLLEVIAAGPERPALIIGMPVGFVGAAEAKDALIAHAGTVPYITLRGTRGGIAMAAAAVNALAAEVGVA